MIRKFCSLTLTIVLLLGILAVPAGAGTLSNFKQSVTYSGQFSDVPTAAWYAGAVKSAYEMGLIGGKSATSFDPAGNLTLAEAAKLAASLHSIFETGTAQFPAATPWYAPYVGYLTSKGLLPFIVEDWSSKATRAQFAAILAACLPESALTPINELPEKTIPDVASSATYYDAVYVLYRAGILTGSDTHGAFKPNTYIQRSEVATVVTRMALPSQRKILDLDTALSAQALFTLCSPAVGYVEVFDHDGTILGTGSGFFLEQNGKFVTNYHVIEGAYSATVRTPDGKTRKITGAYGVDAAMDLALLQAQGSGFPYLIQGDSKALSTGQTIYTIGSPQGLENSLSTGIVSSPSRLIGGVPYIQTTAAISPGSSGGALLDEQGRVIGVTTASLPDGQSLNFAVPIHLLTQMKTTSTPQPLSAMQAASAVGISVSCSNPLTIAAGTPFTFDYIFSDPGNLADTCDAIVADPSILRYSYGDWRDKMPLTVTGMKPGTTSITLALYDVNDRLLGTHTLVVTVTGSAASAPAKTIISYPGMAPTVDFGAYVGAPIYDYISENGAYMYWYRVSDIQVSAEEAVSGYFSQLIRLGFKDTGSYDDEYGEKVTTFHHPDRNIVLGYSITRLNAVPCICIFVSNATL